MAVHRLKSLSKAASTLKTLLKTSRRNTNCQVALFTSIDKEPIKPWLTIKELIKTEFKNNSGETPLLVKIIPATQDQITAKTIYIRDTDDDGELKDEYVKVTVKNKEDLRDIYKNGKGLIHLDDPKNLIVSFDEIGDGKKYQIYKYSQDFAGWQKKEADAMEAETLLSMKAYLVEKLRTSPINLPTDGNGGQIQEWDGILLSEDTLYLLEAKHAMTVEKVKKIAERVNQFPKMIQLSSQKMFNAKYSKIVGVACGTQFPDGCREEAHRLGLMVVYPSGSRYRVDGKVEFDYTIQR
jgi:hypothetical protein